MANYIKPGKDPGVITKIIDMLEVDFIVLGLGMQEAMPYDLDLLHPNLARLLFLCNEKAKVFSVRGEKTEHWLKKVGLDKAIALGCPSLFVYPQNIMNLTPPDPEKVRTALTGGYISDRAPRSYAIVSLFEDFKAHYVMQQEMFVLKEFFEHVDSLYNDATGEVEKELLNIVLENIHGKKMPFESYRWFQDPHAWRVFASQADFYLGDRFHGGVAALQAGVPSLIIAEDLRVHELTDFFKIPNITFKEIHKTSVKELVAKYLSAEKIQQLRQTYYERFLSFKEVMCKNGIQLAVSIEDTKNDIASVSERASAISKPRIIRRIISKFT
jgi:hypothetical protein